ncbi:glycosyltransferase family A protein [Fusobacterium perfoetens]|uniref:glycosyltransferase family 2 protein n=1 Tax=Fusobacterium perfoetens TaxID=852 RepID=UPI0026ED8CCE|nr:glycosyltransferase family A protein [Fusobacterium perfoetens]
MKNSKKVSIIIPCYNAETYLEETLQSVEKQTCDNIEVILIDDGSKDRTYEILANYKEKSLREVIVIRQENKGVSKARNTGITNATGEYICFLDGDDIISPFFIEKLIQNCNKETYVSTYYSRNLVEVISLKEENIKIKKLEYQEGIDYIMLRKRNINFWGAIFSREILQEYDIKFPEDLIIGEDNVFMWNYLSHMKDFILIDAPLYGYRLVPTSASFQKTERVKDAILGIKYSIDYTNKKSDYLNKKLKSFMLARTKLAVAKYFVQQNNINSLNNFRKQEWKIKDFTSILREPCGTTIKIAAFLVTITPKIFYYILIKNKGNYKDVNKN